jgi:hypothetical protein
MQSGRMYEIRDTYDALQTVAIKKEKDSEKADQTSLPNGNNVIRLPQPASALLKDIRCASGSSHDDVADPQMKDGQNRHGSSSGTADPCVKTRRLRAHWERIEGVGLRCTWTDEPDDESAAEADADVDNAASNHADTEEPDAGPDTN